MIEVGELTAKVIEVGELTAKVIEVGELTVEVIEAEMIEAEMIEAAAVEAAAVEAAAVEAAAVEAEMIEVGELTAGSRRIKPDRGRSARISNFRGPQTPPHSRIEVPWYDYTWEITVAVWAFIGAAAVAIPAAGHKKTPVPGHRGW